MRVGSARYYTNNVLGNGEDSSAYYLSDGKLVIVHKQIASERLVDAVIKISDKKIEFRELTLCRYVESNDVYYVAPSGYVLYVIESESAPVLTVNGSAVAVIGVS